MYSTMSTNIKKTTKNQNLSHIQWRQVLFLVSRFQSILVSSPFSFKQQETRNKQLYKSLFRITLNSALNPAWQVLYHLVFVCVIMLYTNKPYIVLNCHTESSYGLYGLEAAAPNRNSHQVMLQSITFSKYIDENNVIFLICTIIVSIILGILEYK